jgi:superfamily II DNA or RNA helicase
MVNFSLRSYQVEAINSWKANDYVSMLEMATGTGKTITAIAAVAELAQGLSGSGLSVLVVVICPYLHLLDQWRTQLGNFGISSIDACETSKKWHSSLESELISSQSKKGKVVFAVTTQATFTSPPFQALLSSTSSEIVLVADEVHNLGSSRALRCLPKNARYRLGLSATPHRIRDQIGEEGLQSYFGAVSFRLNLKQAIKLGFLTPYKYLPRVVPLTDAETQDYADLTQELAGVLNGSSFEDLDSVRAKRAGAILRARASLIGDAQGKLKPFLKDFEENLEKSGQLIYCSEGAARNSSEGRQLERIQKQISSSPSVRSAIYDATVGRADRQILLNNFSKGSITHLLSMRCLDEGVDIPSAKIAYILASSSNPRQFIQRRGRVLRTAPGKESAIIYDYFVLPKMSGELSRLESENRIVSRELERTLEFIDACDNKAEALGAIEVLRGIYERYQLESGR